MQGRSRKMILWYVTRRRLSCTKKRRLPGILGVGAIQEGDPGYEEFLDDLDYARSVCEYAKGLNSGGKGVEEGTKSPGEVRSFEDAQEEFRQKRRNPR